METVDQLIVVPTYNEAPNIEPLVDRIMENAGACHILFVDDNSPDGTQTVIKKMQERYPRRVYLLAQGGKGGLSKAYIAGLTWGLSRHYRILVEMDADLSHDPGYLPQMFHTLETQDVAVGSRYIDGGGVANWGLLRRLISRFGSFYARKILGFPIQDATGGFNGWRAQVLEAIGLHRIQSEGYSFQIEMKYRAWLQGFRIGEFPIIFADRRVGQSKMSSAIVFEAMYRIIFLRRIRSSKSGRRAAVKLTPGA